MCKCRRQVPRCQKKNEKIVRMSGARCHGAKTSPVPETRNEKIVQVSVPGAILCEYLVWRWPLTFAKKLKK
jgi:hypothetical protein